MSGGRRVGTGTGSGAPGPTGFEQPWDPWSAADIAGVEVRVDEVADLMGGGLCAMRNGRAIVVLSPSLSPAERRCVLAHELVHLEWGTASDHPGMPPEWGAVVSREEAAVDHEVARRLVPDAVVDAAIAEARASDGASGDGATGDSDRVQGTARDRTRDTALDTSFDTALDAAGLADSLGVTTAVVAAALDRALLRRRGC